MTLWTERRARGECGRCGCGMLPEWVKAARCPTCCEAQCDAQKTIRGKRRAKRYRKKHRPKLLAARREERRLLAEEARTTGRCIECFQLAEAGRRRCAEHLAYQRAQKSIRAARQASGLPTARGTPPLKRERPDDIARAEVPIGPLRFTGSRVLAAIARFDDVTMQDLAIAFDVEVDAESLDYQALSQHVSRLKREGHIAATGDRPAAYYVPRQRRAVS